MAFVTCGQFKTSQEAQDNATIKAEQSLLDGVVGNGTTFAADSAQGKGGTITAEKIKQAIAGDVQVAVKSNGGITGDGSAENPLALDATVVGKLAGSSTGGTALLQALKDNDLLGDGLNVENGKLVVTTESITDASGTVHQFYAVEK